MQWLMLPRWLVSTPIRTFAHPAKLRVYLLDVDKDPFLVERWVWTRGTPPPSVAKTRPSDRS